MERMSAPYLYPNTNVLKIRFREGFDMTIAQKLKQILK